MNNIYLTDLIDISLLQRLQDSFSAATGLAAQTTDADGKPVTQRSNFTEFCSKLVRNSEPGHVRCEECAKKGAECTLKSGKSEAYRCHTGLTDFSAPIMLQNQMIGCFVGGQALTEEPIREKCDKYAMELGIDKDVYWNAIKEVPVIDKERIESAAMFLFESASVLSDIAYGKYRALESAREMENVSNMKSEFLANISHEIRTPMNAIIGMTEVALREEMPPAVKDYILQIKNAGNSLLSIVNDILDFSKIESGTISIIPEKYELMSIVHDATNILMNSRGEKDIDLFISLNPTLPRYLKGDSLRIKQVLLNIANNALKFTSEGYVRIDIDYETVDENRLNLIFTIKDTGIGIPDNQLEDIFESFHQLDSRRSRANEGAGLGLAICKKLLEAMGGNISVSSKRGEGSIFRFELIQEIMNHSESFNIENKKKLHGFALISNNNELTFMEKEAKKHSIRFTSLDCFNDFKKYAAEEGSQPTDEKIYFFTDESTFDSVINDNTKFFKDVVFIVFTDYKSFRPSTGNIIFVKKPLSTIAIDIALSAHEAETNNSKKPEKIVFTAPEARILVVDDSLVNLKVVSSLLKPLKMQLETANSGFKALEMLKNNYYDLVFMDHMMPEMDGIETTKQIRRQYPEHSSMPIVALTANAVGGAREMFLAEGMSDFVAKPIEITKILSVLENWLPSEKIIKSE